MVAGSLLIVRPLEGGANKLCPKRDESLTPRLCRLTSSGKAEASHFKTRRRSIAKGGVQRVNIVSGNEGGSSRSRHLLAARKRQPECGHLVIIANQQDIANEHGVIPRLALYCREPCELGELIGGRLYERELAFL